MPLVVASHNVMHGRGLRALLPHYAALRREVGLHVLCVQEDQHGDDGSHSERIADAVGNADCVDGGSVDDRGVAIVFDRRQVRCVDRALVPLPRLAGLSWLERRYIVAGAPEQKYALVAALEPLGPGAPLTAVSFHLDSAGGNLHRRAQVAAIAAEVSRPRWPVRLVACGDTNAFVWRRRRQPAVLRRMLAPLTALGAVDPDERPTHFFARQREPSLAHRLSVALGRVGIDSPQRYDVVCTNLPVERRGHATTPASDHDLVWAAVHV